MKFRKILALILVFLFSFSFLSADTATSYDDINFPQWTKDLRRTEIITFGSLPFVTLWTTVGYSLIVKGSFHNPLDKSTSSFTENEQKKIMAISALTSIGFGLTDLAINLITRQIKTQKQRKVIKTITVIPLSEQIKEERLPPPAPNQDDEFEDNAMEFPQKDYFISGMEDAVF